MQTNVALSEWRPSWRDARPQGCICTCMLVEWIRPITCADAACKLFAFQAFSASQMIKSFSLGVWSNFFSKTANQSVYMPQFSFQMVLAPRFKKIVHSMPYNLLFLMYKRHRKQLNSRALDKCNGTLWLQNLQDCILPQGYVDSHDVSLLVL